MDENDSVDIKAGKNRRFLMVRDGRFLSFNDMHVDVHTAVVLRACMELGGLREDGSMRYSAYSLMRDDAPWDFMFRELPAGLVAVMDRLRAKGLMALCTEEEDGTRSVRFVSKNNMFLLDEVREAGADAVRRDAEADGSYEEGGAEQVFTDVLAGCFSGSLFSRYRVRWVYIDGRWLMRALKDEESLSDEVVRQHTSESDGAFAGSVLVYEIRR